MSLHTANPADTPRPVWQAISRGIGLKCPQCGTGSIFRKYLKPVDSCADCGEHLHHHRADDAPPYFTILIVGHVVMPGILLLEKLHRPDLWIHAAIWLPLTIILSLAILPLSKGALINLQWALRMHGFASDYEPEESPAPQNV